MYILELMAAPFAECMVLVAIHTYLGIHVLKRRVIFVDLALAQIAALGTTVGFIFGIMPETAGALVFSMGFTFLGAAVFSITRYRQEKVPQEAVIGLSYAIACAIAILVVEKTQGAEHLKDILVGNLLWVKWSDVGLAAAMYLVIGVVHYVFRDRFLMISEDPDAAYRAGISVRAWDFLFYLTFGAVISFSTRVAGVLLVFVFLVAPAILAFMLTNRLLPQLLIGWVAGTVVTIMGLFLSWKLDLPSGPAVISFYGVALILAGVVVYLWRAEDRLRALRIVVLSVAAAAAAFFAFWSGGTWLGAQEISISEEAHHVAASHAAEHQETERVEQQAQKTHCAAVAARIGGCVGPHKIAKILGLAGPEERLQLARSKMAEQPRRGLEFLLVTVADEELPLLYREEAAELLKATFGTDFGYDAEAEIAGNKQALGRICDRVRALKRGEAGGGGKGAGKGAGKVEAGKKP